LSAPAAASPWHGELRQHSKDLTLIGDRDRLALGQSALLPFKFDAMDEHGYGADYWAVEVKQPDPT
jgi:hypothetical protein